MNNEPQNVSLPANLQQQFALLERRLWKVETAKAVSIAVIALIVSLLVLFFSDRIWDSPTWFRALVFAAGVSTAAFALINWLRLWVLKRRDLRDYAVLVQKRFRHLGDRLLGIVELAGQKEHPANFSPELYRAAIRQVAAEAEKYNFREAVETLRTRKLISVAIGTIVFLLLPLLATPSATLNAAKRWAAPLASIERYTLVEIAGLSNKIIVPHGEGFRVEADVKYHSFWHPSKATARFAKKIGVESKVRESKVAFQIPGQVEKGALNIKVGDARKTVAIEPSYRPSLKELVAQVELPDYLRYPAAQEKLRGSTIKLLEGSRIAFNGKASRNLTNASLHDGKQTKPLPVNGDAFSSDASSIDGVSQFSFLWQDVLGLSNATPWKLLVQTEKDRAPSPDLPGLGRDIAILHSDVLDLRVVAKDDYGVSDLGISWEFYAASEQEGDWASTEVKISKNTPQEKVAEETFRWSPTIFRVPPDSTIELVAFASDFMPGRERSESPVRRLNILSNEKHAELVRQNLESVLARIEEVARLEEKVLARTGEIAENTEMKPKEAAEKIAKAESEQQQGTKTLDELSKEGMQALREALKNPVFNEQALQDWTRTLKQMQELASGKMKEAASDLKNAQQNAGDPESKQKDLASAQSKLEEILKELEELQGKVNKGLDDLQALTLSERLRKVGETEKEIGSALQKIIPETIGLLPKELPEKFKKLESNLGRIQDDTQKETQTLLREIHRFFERTQKPNYGEVSQQMKEARTPEELEQLRILVENNVSMEATRNLATWSKRFIEWADKLQPPESESSSPSGQGQGGESLDMTKTLIALLRLREGELNLHRQTQLLEEQKAKIPNYADRAGVLLSNQQKITEGLAELEKENKAPPLAQPYKETRESMAEVESFLQKPQTDQTTTQAQTRSVELLTDLINLINEQAQRNPPPPSAGSEQQASSEDMAFLMQMMAPQPGEGQPMQMSQGGGNKSGGSTDQASTGATGNATGKSGETRKINKASGAASINLPSEFRETLENYYKALEQQGK